MSSIDPKPLVMESSGNQPPVQSSGMGNPKNTENESSGPSNSEEKDQNTPTNSGNNTASPEDGPLADDIDSLYTADIPLPPGYDVYGSHHNRRERLKDVTPIIDVRKTSIFFRFRDRVTQLMRKRDKELEKREKEAPRYWDGIGSATGEKVTATAQDESEIVAKVQAMTYAKEDV